MACDKNDSKVCSVYTWFPFDKGSDCGRTADNFIQIDECVLEDNNPDPRPDIDCFNVHYGRESYQRHSYIRDRHVSNGDGMKNDREQMRNVQRPSSASASAQQAKAHHFDHISTFNNDTLSPAMPARHIHFENINSCYNEPMVVLSPPPTVTPTPRQWDKKYTRQFFTSNYKPYGLIEFREWNVANIDMDEADGKPRPSSPEYQWFHTDQRTVRHVHQPHFYEKIPSNFGGCQYRALLFIWPPFVTLPRATFYGLEHKLMLDVARYMNFQLVEEYVDIQNMSNVKSRSEQLYQRFLDSNAALAFGNVYPNAKMQNYVDYSIGYLYDLVNWVVPLAGNQPTWLNLVNCFR